MNLARFRGILNPYLTLIKLSKQIHTCHDLSGYRSLVKIQGQDSSKFLQNLITNDINRLSNGEKKSLYAMMLNDRGRIMYDVIIYKLDPNETDFLIEVDSQKLTDFLKMLTMFKIKKKVTISSMDEDMRLGALIAKDQSDDVIRIKEDKKLNVILCETDPRYSPAGHRVIVNKKENINQCFENVEESNLKLYKKNLYRNGIAENDDINYGSAIPLEYNVELMDGVRFDKGCYLGQELIAKTHFTGVVRKRVTPIFLNQKCNQDLFESEANVLNSKTGKNVGKLKGLIEDTGIAMLRVELLDKDNLVLVDKTNSSHPIQLKLPKYWNSDENLLKTIKPNLFL